MIQSVTIPLPYKVSTNAIYAGAHWRIRAKYKDMMRWAMLLSIAKLKPVTSCSMRFEFFFKKKPLDCSNCSFMAKMIEDCLVEHKIIADDSPQYVTSITLTSSRGNDEVILTLEANNEN